MPSKTEKQRRFFGAVMGAKEGKSGASKKAKEVASSMSKKTIKDFLHKKEETMEKTSILENTDILTEQQKTALKGMIDQIIEDRVKEKSSAFIKQYTSFIVEQATKKLSSTFMSKISNRVNEEMESIKTKADQVCKSVIVESSNKIANVKRKHSKLVEEFKATAPKLIENLANQKAQELAEDAIIAIKQNEKLANTVEGITKGLESMGYVINEDVGGKFKNLNNENLKLKTQLIKKERDIRFSELCEGMLPVQKKEMSELLSECTTVKSLEDKFPLVKSKIMKKEAMIEENIEVTKKVTVINEEDNFTDLLVGAKKFIKKS
jgi:hypothetical protein